MTAPADLQQHVAEQPSWDCMCCGRTWPCAPARERLMAELDRITLAIFMWVKLEEAVADLPPGPAAELFERFIGWTH